MPTPLPYRRTAAWYNADLHLSGGRDRKINSLIDVDI